jgi:DNA-binding beta-propeller fold protein YncE
MHATARETKTTAVRGVFFVAAVLAATAIAEDGGNPFVGRQERANEFAFAAKPVVAKKGEGFVISFAATAACDATVAVLDKDGKIVRHLASGVLGKNAPWPFQQNALAQAIVWDGKDDAGKVAPTGCRASVGLGLHARLDGFIGWSRQAMVLKEAVGLAVDSKGEIYVVTGGHEESGLQVSSPHVYVFSRELAYLRTILPPPATVTGRKARLVQWSKTAAGADVPNRRMSFVMNTFTRDGDWANLDAQGPVITADGRLLLLSSPGGSKPQSRVLAMLDTRDGSCGDENFVDLKCAGLIGSGPVCLALSPDGKWLYLSGAAQANTKSASHAVCRVAMTPQPGAAEVFIGKPAEPGDDNAHFSQPRSVACDAAGNVYVADFGNNRIQVFKSDGGYLKTLPAKAPAYVAVHRKTGAIYFTETGKQGATLSKLSSLSDPAVRGTATVPAKGPLALDADGDPATIWFCGNSWQGYANIGHVRDDGEKLTAGTLRFDTPKAWVNWTPWSHHSSLAASKTSGELLLTVKGESLRINGVTGEVLGRVPGKYGYFVADGLDGCFWLQNKSLSDPKMHIFCYDPAKDAKDAREVAAAWQHTIGRGSPDKMGVAPNGDLYIPFGLSTQHEEELKQAGFTPPPKTGSFYKMGGIQAVLLYVYSPDGKLKTMNALPGLGMSNGIHIGRRGELYIVLACQPSGAVAPEGLAADVRWDKYIWGTLVKFDSRFDKFPAGRIIGNWGDGAKLDKPQFAYARNGGVNIENLAWCYPGVSPQPMGGGSACCTCWRSSFDLDEFDRAFVPAAHACAVNVLDANGNMILRMGGYGNADSMGKDSAVVDPKTGEFRPPRPDDPKDLISPLAQPEIGLIDPSLVAVSGHRLYVHDRGNERIVRAVLKYAVEETATVP